MNTIELRRAIALATLTILDKAHETGDAQSDALITLERRRAGVVYARLGLVKR